MADPPFHPSQLTASTWDTTIRDLEDEETTLAARLAQVREQLDWWRKGRALYARDTDGAAPDAHPEARATEADPPAAAPAAKPSLRQAILRVMLDKPPEDGRERHWRSKEVIEEVERRGWLPGGTNPHNLVRRMLRAMVEDEGPLLKPEYGTFALAPSIRDREYSELPVGGRMR
jgi:hypothetical protein